MFNQEDVLIPFNTSPLPPGPWLVFAPHADDETFGMGGTLLKAKAQGVETHLVVLTDGSQGGASDDLVNVRLREVEQAADLLGIKSIECWSEPDRFLNVSQRVLQRAYQKLLQLIPKTVFFQGLLRYIRIIELRRCLLGRLSRKQKHNTYTQFQFPMRLGFRIQ